MPVLKREAAPKSCLLKVAVLTLFLCNHAGGVTRVKHCSSREQKETPGEEGCLAVIQKTSFLWKWTLVGWFYPLKTLMADHLRHISGAIALFSDAIPGIFDSVSRTWWSEPRLARAWANRRLQCSYWPPWREAWLLAGHPRTLDVRTAFKGAPGSAYQIISCHPSTLTWRRWNVSNS